MMRGGGVCEQSGDVQTYKSPRPENDSGATADGYMRSFFEDIFLLSEDEQHLLLMVLCLVCRIPPPSCRVYCALS